MDQTNTDDYDLYQLDFKTTLSPLVYRRVVHRSELKVQLVLYESENKKHSDRYNASIYGVDSIFVIKEGDTDNGHFHMPYLMEY